MLLAEAARDEAASRRATHPLLLARENGLYQHSGRACRDQDARSRVLSE
jgi:hypothetical protein